MAERDRLEVRLRGEHVADVLDAGLGDTAVRYTDRGVALGLPARLSLSLPVRAEPYPSATHGTRWVRSLLPEGRALAHAVREYEVEQDDRFALLSVLGRDVAGALEITPPGAADVVDGHYEPLSDEQLADLAIRAHDIPLGLDRDRGVRLSLAGMQDKFLLHRKPRSTQYLLPVAGAPSTIIVKPEPVGDDVDVPAMATNEAFCMTLAGRVGLDVAPVRVERFGDVSCLLVDRFDRERLAGGQVRRVHQEDMLAALGRDPLLKYEGGNAERVADEGGFVHRQAIRSRPGPSLDDVAGLLDAHLGRASLLSLLAAITFNVAIGNADAHARNYSVLLHPDGTATPAPLYDLVCTRWYPSLTSEAAQFVNGRTDLDQIGAADLIAHATQWGLPETTATVRVEGLLDRVEAELERAVERTVDAGGNEDVAGELAGLVAARVAAMTALPHGRVSESPTA